MSPGAGRRAHRPSPLPRGGPKLIRHLLIRFNSLLALIEHSTLSCRSDWPPGLKRRRGGFSPPINLFQKAMISAPSSSCLGSIRTELQIPSKENTITHFLARRRSPFPKASACNRRERVMANSIVYCCRFRCGSLERHHGRVQDGILALYLPRASIDKTTSDHLDQLATLSSTGGATTK